jgi:hypothetical protein
MMMERMAGQEEAQRESRKLEAVTMSANLTSWAALLLPHESLLYACPVLHKSGTTLLRSTMKRRHLLLTDFPRLLCVKETNDELKVKSEVILGVPRSFGGHAVQMYPSYDLQADEYDWSDSPLTKQRPVLSMRRQSSAGPLLSSTSSANGGSTSEAGNTLAATPPQPAFRRQSSTGFNLLQRTSSQATEATKNNNSPRSSFVLRTPSAPSPSPSLGDHWSAGNSTPTNSRNSVNASTVAEAVQTSPNIMTSVESKSQKVFVIHTPARTYQYEDPSGDATHWVKSITMAARRHGEAVTGSNM